VWVRRAPASEDGPELWEAMAAAGVDVFTSNLPPSLSAWCADRRRAADVRTVLTTALSTSAMFGLALAATRGNARVAEDAVDLVHSSVAMVASSRVAAAVASASDHAHADKLATRRQEDEAPRRLTLPLPTDRMARRFVLASTSYFGCDVALILGSLARGVRPHQWQGRLAHHVVQFAANLPALLCSPPRAAVVRRYLLLAYAAEASTIVLRLKALARAAGVGGEPLQRAAHRLLLASFVVFRLLLFPSCTRLIWQAREQLPPAIYKLHVAFAAAGIALSTGWFVQLARRALPS
jgi:hypothetical protein